MKKITAADESRFEIEFRDDLGYEDFCAGYAACGISTMYSEEPLVLLKDWRGDVQEMSVAECHEAIQEYYLEYCLEDELKRLYSHIGHDLADIEEDLKNGYLSQNTGRDGVEYWWYMDETTCAAIPVEGGEVLEEESFFEENFE